MACNFHFNSQLQAAGDSQKGPQALLCIPHVSHLGSFGFVKGDRSKRQAENFTQQK
jgi:hypothetical protein